jgi:hypothetical protein
MRLPSSGRLSQECLDFRVEVSGDGEGFRIFVYNELEMSGVIVDGYTPFAIVIFEHQGIVFAHPLTSFFDHNDLTLQLASTIACAIKWSGHVPAPSNSLI